jgi:hypothetical protein
MELLNDINFLGSILTIVVIMCMLYAARTFRDNN